MAKERGGSAIQNQVEGQASLGWEVHLPTTGGGGAGRRCRSTHLGWALLRSGRRQRGAELGHRFCSVWGSEGPAL